MTNISFLPLEDWLSVRSAHEKIQIFRDFFDVLEDRIEVVWDNAYTKKLGNGQKWDEVERLRDEFMVWFVDWHFPEIFELLGIDDDHIASIYFKEDSDGEIRSIATDEDLEFEELETEDGVSLTEVFVPAPENWHSFPREVVNNFLIEEYGFSDYRDRVYEISING